MSKTLEELRGDLARETGLLIEGAATGGAVGNLVDDDGLVRFDTNDELNGGMIYILEDAGGLGAAPEGQWRFITDYVAASWQVDVEYDFTIAPAVGDLYEIYRVPLTLDQWTQCINDAILDAWPEVWRPARHSFESTGVGRYTLKADAEEVQEVFARGWDGTNPPAPQERLIRGIDYNIYKGPTDDTFLHMLRPLPINEIYGIIRFYVFYRDRYDELAATESTYLDPAYIKAAAAANLYGLLADNTRGQADEGRYLQLLNYWQEQAQMQKRRLVAGLPQISNPALAQQEKKR